MTFLPLYSSIAQVRNQGELFHLNFRLNLPGVSGRLVYKQPVAGSNSAIFILEGFEEYVEAIFDGSGWEVIRADGTRYFFGTRQYSIRNPLGHTAFIDSVKAKHQMPKFQVEKWHLDRIRNYNEPHHQQIHFIYEGFGEEELYPELWQPQVKQWLSYWDTVARVKVDPFDLGTNGICPLFVYLAGGSLVSLKDWVGDLAHIRVFKDVLLKRVYSTDLDNMTYEQVDFKHKSWIPANEIHGQDFSFSKGRFLQLDDPKVVRLDSMYSKKVVYFRGQDKLISQLQRPPENDLVFEDEWRRYMHPGAYQHKASDRLIQISSNNPYAARYNYNGLNNYFLIGSRKLKNDMGKIPFTHSVLESPRLDLEDMPGGDDYEIRTTIEVPPNSDINFDVNVVTGLRQSPPGQGGYVSYTFDSTEFRYADNPALAQNLPGGACCGAYEDKGLSLFNTFDRLFKWNASHNGSAVTLMQTHNRFRLPNLPNIFDGFHVQVGPGNDNLDYGVMVNSSQGYPEFYNNLDWQGNPERNYNYPKSQWFGTGAPFEPLYTYDGAGLYRGTPLNTNKGVSNYRRFYWYNSLGFNYSGFAPNQTQGVLPNQPTAVTLEYAKATGQPVTGTFSHTGLSNFHTAPLDASLINFEISRISKNPYMLDEVVFSRGNGAFAVDLVPVASFKIFYSLAQVPVINNYDPSDPTGYGGTPHPYKILVNSDTAFRNIWQLHKIVRQGVDTLGQVMPSQNPVTVFDYYKDLRGTQFLCEAYLLKSVWSELGGKTTYTYNLASDTTKIFAARASNPGNLSALALGKGIYVQKFTVSEVAVEDANQALVTSYTFQNPVRLYQGIQNLPDEFQNGYNDLFKRHWVRGFQKAIVEKPLLGGAVSRARTEYTYRVSLANQTDSLLFGKLLKVQDYDANGFLISQTENTYEASIGLRSGLYFENYPLLLPDLDLQTMVNKSKSFERDYLWGTPEDRRMDAWFVRLTKRISISRDPVSNLQISDTTFFTYYDWDETFADTEADYSLMYEDNPFVNGSPFYPSIYHTQLNGYRYLIEPSWQLASATTRWSEKPGAYSRKRMFYLWDAQSFFDPSYYPAAQLVLVGAIRPLYLTKQYGIRSLPYEIRTEVYDGNPNAPPYAKSTWFWYDIFRDVTLDYIRSVDSSGYIPPDTSGGNNPPNDTIVPPPANGGGVVSTNPGEIFFIRFCLTDGIETAWSGIINEIVDDPRYVQGLDGKWYYFTVAGIDTLSETSYRLLADLNANGPEGPIDPNGPNNPWAAGFTVGPNSRVKYFGDLPLRNGGTLNAGDLKVATENYGREAFNGAELTDYSQQKRCLFVFPPSGEGSKTPKNWETLPTTGSSNPILASQVGDPSEGWIPQPLMPNFIDVLSSTFQLRAVYEQADANLSTNYDSLPQGIHSIHHIWHPRQYWAGGYYASNWYFDFKPRFPTIKTYEVHVRDMYGQIIDESDARGLHTVYEYDKATWHEYWDNTGLPKRIISRYDIGLPQSVIVTDHDRLVQTTIFKHNTNGSLKETLTPNRENIKLLYDLQGRLTSTIFNGKLLHETVYKTWSGDITQSFATRIANNYMQTKEWQNPLQYSFEANFFCPLGRNVQSVRAISDAGGLSKVFAGKENYDTWMRTLTMTQAYEKNSQTGLAFDPVVPGGLLYSEVNYEPSSRSRVLRSSKFGNSIASQQSVRQVYKYVSLGAFVQETGITNAELAEILPGLQIGQLTGAQLNALLANNKLNRSQITDEDEKTVISFSTQTGQMIATLSYEDVAQSPGSRVLTLFAHDNRGNNTLVIHPNKLRTTRKFNFQSWVYQTESPDDGLKTYVYSPAGDLKAYQDENLRAQGPNTPALRGRIFMYDYDKAGRVVRQHKTTLGVNSDQFGGLFSPLNYDAQPGYFFRNTHTIWDFLPDLNNPMPTGPNNGPLSFRFNCDDDLPLRAQPGTCFPCLQFTPVFDDVPEKEFRYELGVGSGDLNYYPDADLAHIPPGTGFLIGTGNFFKGRLSLEKIFGDDGLLREMNFHTYTIDGNPSLLIRQFNPVQITAPNKGKTSTLSYGDYDFRGKPSMLNLDLNEDLQTDIQYYTTFNDWGLTRQVFFSRGDLRTAGSIVADYVYDPVTLKVSEQRYYASDPACNLNLEVDNTRFIYDHQYRLSFINSNFMDFGLWYDGNSPNTANPFQAGAPGLSGAAAVTHTQSWDGNINAWGVKYKVGGQGIPHFSRETIYGFSYDGLNRLVRADASVMENPSLPNAASGYDFAANFGQAVTTQNKAWYGDAQYAYDKMGNFTGLKRYGYSRSGNPNVKVQNWVYNYQSGTNRLAYLATQGLSPQSFGYDANGNLSADVKRGLNSFVYSRNNLPLTYKATGNTDITYGYGSGDQRIYKKTDDHKGNGREEYYLRNLSGSTVGIYNYGSGKWTFDITGYGLIAQKEIDAADFGRPNMPQIVSGLKYFQKDHLGNIRLTYEAGFNRGCVLKYEVISVVDYYPYGKHLRAYFSEEVERYQSTEHERDAESGLDFRGFRMSDAEYGRFVSVDPMAHLESGWTPYRAFFDNPIIYVDPTGAYEDYYENDKGEVKWFDNTAPEIVDNTMTNWKNIGTSYASFDGNSLDLNYQKTDNAGNISPATFSTPAVSGRPNADGKFDYSSDRQGMPNVGPLPEGKYTINPEAVQTLSLKDELIGTGMAWTQTFGKKVGGWPGGNYSWGMARMDINPGSVKVGDIIRSGFTIHGGQDAGSAGCIDCMRGETLFFDKLQKHSSGTSIILKVDYSNLKAPISSPFNSSGTGFK